MGLDITAIRQARFVRFTLNDEEDYDWLTQIHIYANAGFPDRAVPMRDNGLYEYAEIFTFRAGSYSGYNHWREQLTRLMLNTSPERIWESPDTFAGRPFVELIDFSDCEGTIGTTAARKLAKDFQDCQGHADKVSDEYFQELYRQWRKAFEMAADEGCVKFH